MTPWTKENITYVMANYHSMPLYLLSWKVRRGESAVRQKYLEVMRKQKLNK